MGLLVSVRNVDEAEAALAGGADLIDVKEPANGPLGRADDAVIEGVIRAVGDRASISAAGGELELSVGVPPGLAFIKFGLAGWHGRDWASAWRSLRRQLPPGCQPVAVAYADWQNCNAPPLEEIAKFAIAERFGAFLTDTFEKNGATLLDVLPMETIAALTWRCQSAGVPVALAGSLGISEIKRLHGVAPDWFAVRGAACREGRNSSICAERVRHLARLARPCGTLAKR